MKKLILKLNWWFIIPVFLGLLFNHFAYAFNPLIACPGAVVVESGSATTISDDFSSDPISNGWTEKVGTWVYDADNDDIDSPANSSGLLSNDTELDSVNVWSFVEYKIQELSANDSYTGQGVRFTGNIAEYSYAIRYNGISGSEVFVLRECTGVTCSDMPGSGSWSNAITNGDYIGIAVHGTGTSTVFRIWDLGSSLPSTIGSTQDPSDVWGAASHTWTTDPTHAANTGKYVYLYDGAATLSNTTFDNYKAGTFTPK